jgi:F0F1-type ATP synthase delta subunit
MYSDKEVASYAYILSLVKTTRERDLLLEEAAALKKSLFETKEGSIDDVLKTQVRSEVASILRSKKEQGENMEKYLEGLEDAVEALGEVKLELAFDPTEQTLEVVSNWITQNIGEGYLLDINVDRRILGGAKISFKGKYFDGSLIKMVDAALESNKESIFSMINTPKGKAQ